MSEDTPKLHRILRRQLRKAGASTDVPPSEASWKTVLARVDTHYRAADEDRYTLERSIDISGKEMGSLHEVVSAERAQLQGLVGSLPQGVLLLDSDGQVIMANAALRTLAGCEPKAAACMALFGPKGDPVGLGQALALEEVYIRSGRGERPIDIDRVDVGDGRVLWTFTDLTERLTQRTALRKAQVEAMVARRAEKARADFLASMSHELRTPLNAILGYSELLGDDIEDEQANADLQRIHNAGSHLLGLINDVLDLSKVDAGRMEARPAKTDMDTLLASVVQDIRSLVNEGVTVRLNMPPIGDVVTDPTRVRQCLYNLLANAARYTDQGSIEVSVEITAGYLHIAVTDTGEGIASGDLLTLFDPFQQTDNSRGGTGLGLALVRSLIELLGGRCTVTSEVGVGSVFTLELPYQPFHATSPSPLLKRGGER